MKVAANNAGALLGFALSFAVIANYWTIHKDIFRPLRRHDPRHVLLLLFPAQIIAGRLPRKASSASALRQESGA